MDPLVKEAGGNHSTKFLISCSIKIDLSLNLFSFQGHHNIIQIHDSVLWD